MEDKTEQRRMGKGDLLTLEEILKHSFQDRKLLLEAVTHSTYSHEMKQRGKFEPCNERLEFFGDAVVSILVSRLLYERFPEKAEGELTNMRKFLVCREALSEYAEQLSFGEYLRLGKGEEKLNGRTSPSILENAFEAIAGAVYLDAERQGRDGREAVSAYCMPLIEKKLSSYGRIETIGDYKTLLQEIVQRAHEDTLTYVGIGESGPDHQKIFEVEARLNGSTVIGRGSGRTKREAEQAAAKKAITDYFRDFTEV